MNSIRQNEPHYTHQHLERNLLLLILILQVAITLPFISQQALWLDEAYSALLARKNFSEINYLLNFDSGPPFYYYLLHLWQMAAGSSEFALRIPSLLFALMVTITIYSVARREWNIQMANWCALLWATNPLVWYYSLEARNYTLLALATLAFIYTIVLFTRRPYWKTAAWIPVGIILIYTHNLAFFVILAGGLIAVLNSRNLKMILMLMGGGFIIVVSYLPWAPTLYAQMQNTAFTLDWVKHFWSPWVPLQSLIAFIPGGWTPAYMGRPSFPVAVQTLLALLTIGLVSYSIFINQQKNFHSRWLLLALTFLIGFPYLASLIGTPVYLIGRTDFFALPFALIGFVLFLYHIQQPRISHIFIAGYVLFSMTLITMEITYSTTIDQRRFEQFLQHSVDDGDVVISTGLTRPIIEQALRGRNIPLVSYPEDMRYQLAHINWLLYLKTLDFNKEARGAISRAQQARSKNGKIWIVNSLHPINTALTNTVAGYAQDIIIPGAGLRKLNMPLYVSVIF